MKQYRFDYIKEYAEQWGNSIPKTLANIERLPYNIIFFTTPIKDYYGEDIEDMSEWLKQRHEYCVKLVNYFNEEIKQ